MSHWESRELRGLLADGWEVKGFHGDFTIKGTSGDISGHSNGSSILLQKGEHMAIVYRSFDERSGEPVLSVEVLTEDR